MTLDQMSEFQTDHIFNEKVLREFLQLTIKYLQSESIFQSQTLLIYILIMTNQNKIYQLKINHKSEIISYQFFSYNLEAPVNINNLLQKMTLIVRPIQAVLTRDTNFFTSMDPYCCIYFDQQAKKTSPNFGGGLRPVWNQALKFQIGIGNKLGVQIWAKSILGADSFIGGVILDISKLKIGHRAVLLNPVDIYFEGKPSGKILLQMQIIQIPNNIPNNQTQNVSNLNALNYEWAKQPVSSNNKRNDNDFGRGSIMSQTSPFLRGSATNQSSELTEQVGIRKKSSTIDNPQSWFSNNQKPSTLTFNDVNNSNILPVPNTPNKQQSSNNHLNQQLFHSLTTNLSNLQVSNGVQPSSLNHVTNNQYANLMQHHKIQQQHHPQKFTSAHQNSQMLMNKNSYESPESFMDLRKKSSVGIGIAPVKSILNPRSKSKGKENRSGSLSHKKVKFADEGK